MLSEQEFNEIEISDSSEKELVMMMDDFENEVKSMEVSSLIVRLNDQIDEVRHNTNRIPFIIQWEKDRKEWGILTILINEVVRRLVEKD